MPDRPIMTELKVSAHVMRLDEGLYCIFQRPEGHAPNPMRGLPGVRISLPPGVREDNRAVEIAGFRADGWIARGRDAALLRVNEGPAEVLVTVYQATDGGEAPAPHLEVVRIGETAGGGTEANAATPAPPPSEAANASPTPGVLAHVQTVGDVRTPFGRWVGERGSGRWIEGFALTSPSGLAEADLEYQAVLGRDWETPWARAGQFCGSRHMALPIRGLALRLKKEAAARFECAYLARFTDGTIVGPLAPGERCAAESLAPLEALQVILRPRRVVAESRAQPRLAAPKERARSRKAPLPHPPKDAPAK